MQKTDNIFMDSLRFGATKMSTGITLNELTTHLTSLGWTIDKDFKSYYHYWFFTHFYYDNAYNTLKVGNTSQTYSVLKDITNWADIRCPMTSEAYGMYLDFEKLIQTRIDLKQNRRLSNIAILISAGLAFIQIVLQLLSMFVDNNRFCLWCAF